METDKLFLLFQWLREGTEDSQSITELANKLASKNNLKTPFKIDFRNFQDDLAPYDIIISPGNPVEIYINDRFCLELILDKKSSRHFKQRLEQALERMHKVHRTLKHLIPLSTAIAFKKEARDYIKIPNPEFVEGILANKYIEVSYQVTVKDTISNTEITLSGLDPIELRDQAVKRLSLTVFSNEEFMDLLREMEESRKFKVEAKESQILIGGEENELREKRTY